MKRFGVSVLLLLLLPLLAGCAGTTQAATPSAAPSAPAATAGAPKLSRYSVVFMDTFDTVISLIGFAESEEVFNRQAAVAHQLFVDLHKRFDCYNSYEDEGIVSVYTVNEKAPDGPVAVDPIRYALLKFSKAHYEEAHGQTNVALGSVLSIWHDYREAGLADPDSAALPPAELL
ncbi:MAG: FAD:protein FMN transferase, partial [Clostridia bacterium]|nr:FAD:protein FMN transferase [Clostridia bacterium]